MKSYEEICRALSGTNLNAFEKIDEALQVMSPADGAENYRQACKNYTLFCETLNVAALKKTAEIIARVTGYVIPVEV